MKRLWPPTFDRASRSLRTNSPLSALAVGADETVAIVAARLRPPAFNCSIRSPRCDLPLIMIMLMNDESVVDTFDGYVSGGIISNLTTHVFSDAK